jgi:hypothetical protein
MDERCSDIVSSLSSRSQRRDLSFDDASRRRGVGADRSMSALWQCVDISISGGLGRCGSVSQAQRRRAGRSLTVGSRLCCGNGRGRLRWQGTITQNRVCHVSLERTPNSNFMKHVSFSDTERLICDAAKYQVACVSPAVSSTT